jgi:orotidine-5'-phosphate decarboxylase
MARDQFRQAEADAGTPRPDGKIIVPERKLLIPSMRSIIPSVDVKTIEHFEKLVEATGDVPGIGGYKVGLELAIPYGLTEVVARAREHTGLPIIYDHQKAGNDIPDMGKNYAGAIKRAGVEAVILFPFTGPKTESEWIKACQGEGLNVIVGGHMTHPQFLESQGGSISDSAPARIYRLAAENGVTDFVVPGNQAEYVAQYRRLLESILGKGGFTLYAPGFVSQGGDVSETGRVAGENWHAIVGRGIYGAEDMKKAATELTTKLLATPVEVQSEVVFQAQSREEKLAARQERVMQILKDVGGFDVGHFLLKSGMHSGEYVRKDRVYLDGEATEEVCRMMAEDLVGKGIEVVAGPVVGGAILSQEVAKILGRLEGRRILSVFADKVRNDDGKEVLVLKRGFDQVVDGKIVATVEDVITTGGSVRETNAVIRSAGGKVVDVVAIVNRSGGEVTAETLGVPTLSNLSNMNIPTYEPGSENCPHCAAGAPIDNAVGHGGQQKLMHP